MSSSGGNDANSGTSPVKAWKTLAKVNSYIPKTEEQIFLTGMMNGTITVIASGTSGSLIILGLQE